MAETGSAAQAIIIALGTAAITGGITAYTTISIKNVEIQQAKTARSAQVDSERPAVEPAAEKPAAAPAPTSPQAPQPFAGINVAFAVLAVKPGELSEGTCQQMTNTALVAAKAKITDSNANSNFFELGDARGFVWCALNIANITPQVFYGVYGPNGLDTFASRDRIEAAIKPALADHLVE